MCMLMILSLFVSEYVDLQRRFAISVAEGYQVTTVTNQNPFLYIGKDVIHGSYPNLNIVQADPILGDLAQNSGAIIEQLKTRLTDYTALKQEQFVFQDSPNGLKLYGQWKQDGKMLRNIQYYFLMNGALFIITGTSLADEFEKDLPFFERAVHSIRKISKVK